MAGSASAERLLSSRATRFACARLAKPSTTNTERSGRSGSSGRTVRWNNPGAKSPSSSTRSAPSVRGRSQSLPLRFHSGTSSSQATCTSVTPRPRARRPTTSVRRKDGMALRYESGDVTISRTRSGEAATRVASRTRTGRAACGLTSSARSPSPMRSSMARASAGEARPEAAVNHAKSAETTVTLCPSGNRPVGRLHLLDHLVVEAQVFVGLLALAHRNGRARVLVEHTGDHVGNAVAPVHLLTQRHEVLLDALDDRTQVELRILEEGEQELERTVAGAAAEARRWWRPGDRRRR